MLVLSVGDPREAVDGHVESDPVLTTLQLIHQQPVAGSISSQTALCAFHFGTGMAKAEGED